MDNRSLDAFVVSIKEGIEEFEALYRAKSSGSPEAYPLIMLKGNEGLWLEFFNFYLGSGEV